MNNSLYEITAEYLQAFDRLVVDEETGEILNWEIVDAIAGDFDNKVESIACFIKNQLAFTAALKAEEEALIGRRKSAERQVENMKKYLTACMNAVNKDKIETTKYKVSFRNSTSVSIDDVDEIPIEYIVETVTAKPDKTAIKDAIKAGEIVPGASLAENRNIQIK